jgi:hypothetical protein
MQAVVNGELLSPAPVGFIIDSPWLPNWYGISLLDYFTSDELWLKANLKAVETFPDVMFLLPIHHLGRPDKIPASTRSGKGRIGTPGAEQA